MKYSKYYLITFIALGLISFACSDLKNDLTSPTQLALHGANVLNQSSQDFHGVTVKDKGLESCKQCHDANFDGGTAKVSCATANCHPTIAVHQTGISDPTSSAFHGLFIATNHLKMSDCSQCHGNNFGGGTASPSCTKCHTTIVVHKAGIVDTASADFHGRYVALLNWDMSQCKTCHGNDYSGGVASTSCTSCHKNSGGPEACNTCHGDFNNPNSIAPPVDLKRGKDTSSPGIGAHSTHLTNVTITKLVNCNECHTVPTALNSPGHIDTNGHAEVILNTNYSTYQLGNGTYDYSTNKCSNTYCHGNFAFPKSSSQWQFAYTADKIEGNYFAPKWNQVDGTQGKCGTCHGLPPTGHMASDLSGCATCHIGVVDKYGNIIDKTKHMDGKIEVFGN